MRIGTIFSASRLPTPVSLGSPCGSAGTESACNMGDLGSIPGLGRSPGEGNGNPLQYSCLENPMDGGAWWATVHRVAKSRTRLSDFTFTFCGSPRPSALAPAGGPSCVDRLGRPWTGSAGPAWCWRVVCWEEVLMPSGQVQREASFPPSAQR